MENFDQKNLERRLRELGDQILKLSEHDQLKTEIAMISLKSIYQLLTKNDEEEGNDIPPQFPNMFPDPVPMPTIPIGNINQFGHYDEPQVYASSFNNDLINQASSIPFLFHNQQ